MSHPPICLRTVNERAVLESVLCVSYSHFGVTVKSVPKHVRLGKYGTINAGSNFLYTYILGEARRKC